ncbi:hypothetical protein PPYR_04840 [Photinus pyralis]|uniref:Fcf2 pre-rRNA processing C-terminal domain-containing protein n=1 Tax=Photinus pyralis TaxID=7054 RepID=A0A1Y1N6X0_PHOPY|nr:deoxynucleotidyltransferase terminal-interacting protein 2 [Photinus pyralis]KAB0802654.1 hypothetical protein PPYR_04840 [Photinus pyralis]
MSFFIDSGDGENIPTNSDLIINTTCPPPENEDPNTTIKEMLSQYKTCLTPLNSKLKSKHNSMFDTFAMEMGWSDHVSRSRKKEKEVIDIDTSQTRRNVNDLLNKSVLTPEFETLTQVPPYEVAETRLRLQRQRERAKTKGAKWYGLPATELTKEVKDDLQILQMRSVLDPKRFYKKNDLSVLPKYFQIGKVMDSPLEFYNNRLTKKEKKETLVDELLADAEFNRYNKRKYKEIIEEKQGKAWKQAKKRRRNKNKSK